MRVDDPIGLLLHVGDRLRSSSLAHAVYGALALAAYGRPRFTQETDFAVVGADVPEVLRVLSEAFSHHRFPFRDEVFGGLRLWRMTVFGDDACVNTINLVVPASESYARRVMARRLSGGLRGRQVDLIAPEDFVIFKCLSTRDQDLSDGASICRGLGHDLNVNLIEDEVATLREAIPGFEIAARWARMRERLT